MTLGERIEARLAEKGWSQAELARRIGVQSTSIWKLVTGKSQSSKQLHLIARELETTIDYLTGETNDPKPINLADRRLAYGAPPAETNDTVEVAEIDLRYGLGATYLADVIEAEPRQFSRAWLRHFTDSPPEELFWAKGQGNSMEATIHESDIVLIDRRQQSPRMADLIWAFAFGEIGMIKRLRPMPDGSVKILSDNPAVAAETAHDGELNIIGRVVAVVKRL